MELHCQELRSGMAGHCMQDHALQSERSFCIATARYVPSFEVFSFGVPQAEEKLRIARGVGYVAVKLARWRKIVAETVGSDFVMQRAEGCRRAWRDNVADILFGHASIDPVGRCPGQHHFVIDDFHAAHGNQIADRLVALCRGQIQRSAQIVLAHWGRPQRHDQVVAHAAFWRESHVAPVTFATAARAMTPALD